MSDIVFFQFKLIQNIHDFFHPSSHFFHLFIKLCNLPFYSQYFLLQLPFNPTCIFLIPFISLTKIFLKLFNGLPNPRLSLQLNLIFTALAHKKILRIIIFNKLLPQLHFDLKQQSRPLIVEVFPFLLKNFLETIADEGDQEIQHNNDQNKGGHDIGSVLQIPYDPTISPRIVIQNRLHVSYDQSVEETYSLDN